MLNFAISIHVINKLELLLLIKCEQCIVMVLVTPKKLEGPMNRRYTVFNVVSDLKSL